MSDNCTKLKDYFALFDGTARDWETIVRPAVEALYHDQMKVYSEHTGDKTRDEMIAFVCRFNNAGGKAEMELIEETPEGVIYQGRLCTPDGLNVKIHSLGKFKDGKLFIIEPTNPEVYHTMMSREYRDKHVVETNCPDCPGLVF